MLEILGILLFSAIIFYFVGTLVIKHVKMRLTDAVTLKKYETSGDFSLKDFEKIVNNLKPKEEKIVVVTTEKKEEQQESPDAHSSHESHESHEKPAPAKKDSANDLKNAILISEIFEKKS